jgi:hypothetical protein
LWQERNSTALKCKIYFIFHFRAMNINYQNKKIPHSHTTTQCYGSGEPNFQHSDPRIKLSICEAKIMNSFGDLCSNF